MQVFPGISMDPDIRFGKPCVAGTRVDVATVVGAVGAGDSIEAVGEAYELTRGSRCWLPCATLPMSRLTSRQP